MAREVDRDDLDVTPDHVLVLKNGGPKGGPGMPEWGMLPIPKKLLKAGVRDMLRISDARMSGTSYGACILHVAPESYVGGPLAFVQTGDEIEVDVAARRIHLHVGDEELARRRAAWTPPPPHYRARLWRDVLRPYRPGRRGLRFRFPARPGADRGAGNSLIRHRQDARARDDSERQEQNEGQIPLLRTLGACWRAPVRRAHVRRARRPCAKPGVRVDPFWPKPLPQNWIIGQVGGMAVDAQDNIWVFQRPRSLTDDEKGAALDPPRSKCCVPAPSVLVFNQAGDVVKSWGGPGDNQGYDWPLQEHASWSTPKASSGSPATARATAWC